MTTPSCADTAGCCHGIWASRRHAGRKEGVIFPYNPRSIGHAFRAFARLQIYDLHFHDLRHEGVSRLFEADWDIPQVATVSGHRDWKMLQRYTHLRPSLSSPAGPRARVTLARSDRVGRLRRSKIPATGSPVPRFGRGRG